MRKAEIQQGEKADSHNFFLSSEINVSRELNKDNDLLLLRKERKLISFLQPSEFLRNMIFNVMSRHLHPDSASKHLVVEFLMERGK